MTPALVLAHAGHWALQLLYVGPVIFVAGVIIREKLRDRREQQAEAAARAGETPHSDDAPHREEAPHPDLPSRD